MLKLTYSIDGQKHAIDLNEGSTIIGRASDCDVTIKNGSVSKQHVRIDVRGGQATFRDLMSSNGTRLNSKKMTEGKLQSGDVLRIGKVNLQAEDPAAPAFAPGGEVGETQDIPPAPPLATADDAYAVSDETPPDGNFVPAVPPPESEPRALVQVVRPGDAESQLPATVPGAGQAQLDEKKKKLLVAVGVAIMVIAIGILMLPSKNTTDDGTGQTLNYWGSVKEGEAAFRDGRYAEAKQMWEKIHSQWRKAHPDSSLNVADQYASVARAFEAGHEGRFETIRWLPLRSSLRETVDMLDVIPTDRAQFAHQLLVRIADEMDAQELYQEAERLRESGEYDQAIAKYIEIKPGTVYHAVVNERRQQCLDAQFEELKKAALAHAADREWAQAIEKGQAALEQREDAQLKAEAEIWRENDRVEKLVQRFKNHLRNDRLDEAATSLESLKQVKQGHYAVAGLATLEDQLRKKVYLRKLNMLYATWNEPGLKKAQEEPEASQADAQRIFIKTKNLQKLREKAQEELAAKDPEGPFRARDIWQSILDMEPDHQHPMNVFARNKLRDHKLTDIGARLKNEALDSVRTEDYKRARDLLQMAQTRCKVEVTDAVDTIMEKGRKLYNEGNSLWFASSPRRYEAALKWKKARDCFLPGEKWYKIVDDQIRKKLGEGE